MAASFDRAILEHVARLARLPLSSEEEDALARDLERILEHFSQLPRAHDDVNPAPAEGALREDVVDPAPETVREGILANFTRREGDLLKAPRGL